MAFKHKSDSPTQVPQKLNQNSTIPFLWQGLLRPDVRQRADQEPGMDRRSDFADESLISLDSDSYFDTFSARKKDSKIDHHALLQALGGGPPTKPKKDTYSGNLKNGQKHGQGKMIFVTGDQYEGEWLNDMMHGTGKFISASGDVYEGKWYRGKRDGQGTLP